MEDAQQSVEAPRKRTWLWQPNLIVFLSSACVMTLELVAGRIIAPYVGVSLYTWTSVIGVVLAGMSLGNFVGGKLADRWASPRLLGGIFALGGVLSLGILSVEAMDRMLSIDRLTEVGMHIIVPIVLLTAVLFFLPAAVLGTISPIVAKLAVRDLAKTGSTVGKIYAFGSIGSIVGTFATGFWLISWFGTHKIVWGVAVLLFLIGLLFLVGKQWPWLIVAIWVIGAGTGAVYARGWLDGPCLRETNYFCIKVHDEEKDGEVVRVLILDRLVHSYSSLTDPTHLVYGYERAYATATDYQERRTEEPLSALFIGGGGYTFPRYVEAVYPGSRIDVVEIDPWVTETAYEKLGLSRDTEIASYNEDARMFLERTPDRRYTLIFGDAFNDFSVPYHLTTLEFNERVRAWLSQDGMYIVNVVDGGRANFLRAYLHTVRQTFPYVYLAPSIDSWRTTVRSTFVILAANEPLDRVRLQEIDAEDGDTYLSGQLLSDAELDALLAEASPPTLTDRYAPVDQMMAEVFLDIEPEEAEE